MMTAAGLAIDDAGHEGPPLVLLHGLTFDRRIWQPVVDRVRALDPTRRIVAIDLPGHGESPAQLPHDFDHVIELIAAVLGEAGVDDPVVVGHSISGGIVSLYGARHPVHSIVNVDQPPEIANFARFVSSLADALRGPGFPDVWKVFADSFHTEYLPDQLRALVEANSQPRQDVVLSYWEVLLDHPVEEAVKLIDDGMAELREGGTPYVLIVGNPLPPELAQSLAAKVPQAEVLDWSPSGHFPHLVHLDEFAELLVGIGR